MGRIIGVQHRIKQTKDNQSHPTIISIYVGQGEIVNSYPLADETAELDWLKGNYPLNFREVLLEENLETIPEHHRKYKDGNVSKIPSKYDGLMAGDIVLMILGGSGDRFAAALAKRGEQIGSKVLRVTADKLKTYREDNGLEKTEDSRSIIDLYLLNPEFFNEFTSQDRIVISIRAALKNRTEAMKAKVACETNIFQNLVGDIFLDEKGYFPEGDIDKLYKEAKANDAILDSLEKIVIRADKVLEKAVKNSAIWENVFSDVVGVGPRIAAGIIAAVGNVKRFSTEHKFKKFCGVHVTGDAENGKFPRKRSGEKIDWNPDARQALYLLADQFNRHPDSVWGKKLRENKAKLQEKYPEPIETINGKGKDVKKYTKGHIQKIAEWKTLTQFTVWLYHQWIKL